MSRTIYQDFDEFAESIAGIAGRFVPTAPSAAEWWVQGRQASRISLQQLQIGACSTFAGGGQHEKITLGLPMTNARCMRIDARELREDSFIFMNRAQSFTFAGSGVTRWAGITLPLDHPNLDAGTLEVLGTSDSVRTRTQLVHLTHLRKLVDRILSLDPMVRIDGPLAAAAAEQDIALAVARVLQFSNRDRDKRLIGRPHLPRERVIARCLELIEASHGKQVLIEDLCRAADVSERTLGTVFLEYFGVPPRRLLKAKQLWEIRAALLSTPPGQYTVKQIAARFGVWDFSLFAHNYKMLFAELPSVTLQSPVRASHGNPSLTWLVFAANIFKTQASAGARE